MYKTLYEYKINKKKLIIFCIEHEKHLQVPYHNHI